MTQVPKHWAFAAAFKTMHEHAGVDSFTCASGVTPSGVIHIGNFRELITVDLVTRALRAMGKKARHIHSWDNYDVFRKVPKDMPKREELELYLRKCIVDVPDTYGTAANYAEHHMKAVENALPLLGIRPEYLYQYDKYRACEYADDIKFALEHTAEIVAILNSYRTEPLKEDWLPVAIFCSACGKDTIEELHYVGDYVLSYRCSCGKAEQFDFRSVGIAKLVWRVDWPMRWAHERVNFEPGGKDHSTTGGSFDTGKKIVEQLYNRKAPSYLMYDFVRIKGSGGKISSSAGGVVTLVDVLKVYEPEIVRYLFVSTKAGSEFAISFDADVIKLYEDYDKCERIYFKAESVNEKEYEKQKLIYELCQIEEGFVPTSLPYQVGFRHVTMILQINDFDEAKTFDSLCNGCANKFDEQRLKQRIACASHWLRDYAEEQFRFTVKDTKDSSFFMGLDMDELELLSLTKDAIRDAENEEELSTALFSIAKEHNVDFGTFFSLCYKAIIGKEKGPKLAPFIIEIGKERILKLL